MAKQISEEKTTKNEKEKKTMSRRNNSAYRSMVTITTMIRNQGATADDITEKYGISESTLRRYLHKFFVRSDTINQYNRLLRENAKAKQARARQQPCWPRKSWKTDRSKRPKRYCRSANTLPSWMALLLLIRRQLMVCSWRMLIK